MVPIKELTELAVSASLERDQACSGHRRDLIKELCVMIW
jgi:hypothetical protein